MLLPFCLEVYIGDRPVTIVKDHFRLTLYNSRILNVTYLGRRLKSNLFVTKVVASDFLNQEVVSVCRLSVTQ